MLRKKLSFSDHRHPSAIRTLAMTLTTAASLWLGGCELTRHISGVPTRQETPEKSSALSNTHGKMLKNEAQSNTREDLRPEFRAAHSRFVHALVHRTSSLPMDIPLSVFEPLGAAQHVLKKQIIAGFCQEVDLAYTRLGWGTSPCTTLPWQFSFRSEDGHPLIYWEFLGKDVKQTPKQRPQTTLILGGVHPDEMTPIHLAFAFSAELHKHPEVFADSRVIVAPLVNPDGFFVQPPRRTNANGIDLNRNFATSDWWKRAQALWQSRRRADPRHFPGVAPNTEQGTRFQSELLMTYEPDKILSIHAPLGFLDYDGPGEDQAAQMLTVNEQRALDLAAEISKESNNYRIMNYRFFPGSLGNFAGNERRIPTITVELDSTDPRKANAYKKEFFPGLKAAIRYHFQRDILLASQKNSSGVLQQGQVRPSPEQDVPSGSY